MRTSAHAVRSRRGAKTSRGAALRLPILGALVVAAALVSGEAGASDAAIALGEVAVPPPSSGVDRATLKTAAEGELQVVDTTHFKKARSLVVSVAVVGAEPSPFACTVNALVRDAKTGSMLAVTEGRARAAGDANAELRKLVLRAAMHSAMVQISDALAHN
jgi:hypothetical protein